MWYFSVQLRCYHAGHKGVNCSESLKGVFKHNYNTIESWLHGEHAINIMLVFLLHVISGPSESGASESGHTDWWPKCFQLTNTTFAHAHTHTLTHRLKEGLLFCRTPWQVKCSWFHHIYCVLYKERTRYRLRESFKNYWFWTFHKRKVHYSNMMPAHLWAVMNGCG